MSSGTEDRLPYHDMRNHITFVPIMTHQALKAVVLQGGARLLVLGCPGGKVRVLDPGTMGTTGSGHSVTNSPHETPIDYGYGGGALAVKALPNGDLAIWFGTLYGPPACPASYGSPQGYLAYNEVATGGVHALTWSPAATAPGFTQATSIPLPPSSGSSASSRGGYGVVGLCLADLLPSPSGQDELIVTTLAGDVIVMDSGTLNELWRATVPGSAGCFNAIRVADLNGDGHKELYVAGSFGTWRFIQSGEITQ
jgi:hypothetical protein